MIIVTAVFEGYPYLEYGAGEDSKRIGSSAILLRLKRPEKMKRAVERLPVFCDCGGCLHEDLIHGNSEQTAESEQVIHRRETFALLPFVDCLRLFKTEIMLKLKDRQSAGFSQANNVFSRRMEINGREKNLRHHNSSFSSFRLQSDAKRSILELSPIIP